MVHKTYAIKKSFVLLINGKYNLEFILRRERAQLIGQNSIPSQFCIIKIKYKIAHTSHFAKGNWIIFIEITHYTVKNINEFIVNNKRFRVELD